MFNSIPSDRYVADKRFVADVYSFSQHSRKPFVEPTPTVKIPRIIVKISELPFSLNKSIMKKK